MVNPYDPCVANKMVDGKQLTVTWHVDNLKVLHVKQEVVNDFIEWVQNMYREKNIKKVKPSQGKVYDYLGMDIDCNKPGVFKVLMTKYNENMINEFPYPEEIKDKKARTPAADHLFDVDPKGKPLGKERKECFHSWVANGLFLCK